jgi:protein O-mannosyl-transferase
MARPSFSRWGFLLAAVCALVFLPVLGFDFVTADDFSHVVRNPFLTGRWIDLLLSPFQVPGLYMPTTYSVWWLMAKASLAATGKMHPAWFHALNLIFHALNSALAFSCFSRVGLKPAGAALGAAVFALHPLQVEPVAWVTGFKDVMAGTMALTCVRLSLSGRWRWATLACALALLAKPVGAVTPVIVGLFLWAGGRSLRGAAPWLSGWLVGSAALLGWHKALQPGPSLPLLDRAQVAVDSLGFSFAKALVPVGLSLNYGRTPERVLAEGVLLAGAGVLVALLLLWRFREKRILVASVGLFLTPWLPVSGAVSFHHQLHSTTADRFLYLSALGLGLVFGGLLAEKKRAAAALAVGLAVLSSLQLPHWKNNASLYARMARFNPIAENHYRYAMALVEARRQKEAITPMREAVRLKPTDERYANNLGLLMAEQGRYEEAEAELREALSRIPDSPVLRENLSVLERRREAAASGLINQ